MEASYTAVEPKEGEQRRRGSQSQSRPLRATCLPAVGPASVSLPGQEQPGGHTTMSPVRSPHGLGSVSFLFPGLVRGLNPSFLTPVGPGAHGSASPHLHFLSYKTPISGK